MESKTLDFTGMKIPRDYLYTEEDKSAHAIAVYLNEHIEEHPTKKNKLWNKQQVGGILRNSIYVGMYRSHIEEKQGFKATDPKIKIEEKDQYIHEIPELRIIEDEVWDKAVAILRAREARYSTTDLVGKNTNKHLLSTMLFCSDCGVSYTRKKKHAGLKKDGTRTDLGYFWSCRNYEQYGKKRCSNRYGIGESVAEEQVREEIRRLQREITERNGGALLTNFNAYLKVMYELDHDNDNVEAIKSQILKIERKKNILLEDRMDGLMSKELYQKEVKILNEQVEELEAKVKASSMYDDTIRREWEKFEKYKKMILSLDPDNLTNGDLKQVFNKIYVGLRNTEGKYHPVKYLIFSYAIMGHTVEEIVQMYYEKGYADKDTQIRITFNGGED